MSAGSMTSLTDIFMTAVGAALPLAALAAWAGVATGQPELSAAGVGVVMVAGCGRALHALMHG
jgi:hypothetical protein